MKQIYSSFRKFSGIAVLAPLCKLLEALLELTIPLFVAKIIDVGIVNGDRKYIVTIAFMMVAVGFVIGVVQDSLETAINSSGDVIFCATEKYREWIKQGKKLPFDKK